MALAWEFRPYSPGNTHGRYLAAGDASTYDVGISGGAYVARVASGADRGMIVWGGAMQNCIDACERHNTAQAMNGATQ